MLMRTSKWDVTEQILFLNVIHKNSLSSQAVTIHRKFIPFLVIQSYISDHGQNP